MLLLMSPVIRTVIFTGFVLGFWTVAVPYWLLPRGARPDLRGAGAGGWLLIAAGIALYFACAFWGFALRGKGTPLPLDPPKNWIAIKAFEVDGNEAVPLCLAYCLLNWDIAEKFVYHYFPQLSPSSYALPVLHDSGLPRLPPAGIARLEDFKNAKTAAVIPYLLHSAVNPSFYAYTRQNTRRNLYRIPLP